MKGLVMEMNDVKNVCKKLHEKSKNIDYCSIVEVVDKSINKAIKNRQGQEFVTKVNEKIPYNAEICGILSCNLCYNHKLNKVIYVKIDLIIDTIEYN